MEGIWTLKQAICATLMCSLFWPLSARGASSAQNSLKRAAASFESEGLVGVRRALAKEGYHPFLLRQVSAAMTVEERTDQGLIHCSDVVLGLRLCGRLVARVLDRSPIHLQVEMQPDFPLHAAHLVAPDGRTQRLSIDKAGVIDLPPDLQGKSGHLGITVRGPDGPETGLLLALGQGPGPANPCNRMGEGADVVRAVNELRQELGMERLSPVRAPLAYAQSRQEALRQRFAHPAGGLGPLLRQLSLPLRRAAELLAEDEEMSAVCEGWMRSPSHRAALLDPRRNRIALVQEGDRVAALVWRQR